MDNKTNENNTPQWPYELFGVECGDGWKKLLPPLFEAIEEYNKDLPEDEKVEIHQIKEKFGELRIYLSYIPESLRSLVNDIENKAAHTCELCGSTENVGLKSGGWITTMCHNCALEIAKKRGMVLFSRFVNGKRRLFRIYDNGTEEEILPKELP